MRFPVGPRECARGAVFVVFIAGLSACATNPVTGRREFTLLGEAQEIEIGQQMHPEVIKAMGRYEDAALQQYVEQIGLQLAHASHRPNLPWRFTVVNVPVVNAMALPGGQIYVTRGILAYLGDEAELAGVLGHEIGHVTARHAAQAYTRATGGTLAIVGLGIFVPAARPFGQLAETALGVLFLKHGRDDERQADGLGVEYAAKTGWDPAGVQRMLSTLARIEEASDRRGMPNWLSTHPDPVDRVERVRASIEQANAAAGSRRLQTDRDAYLRRIEGVIFGDDPSEGVVRGRLFLHPVLQFAVEFPEGWEVANSPTQVVASRPGSGDTAMVLQLVDQPLGSVADTARTGMRRAGFREIEGGRTRINGLDAYVGVYAGSVEGMGRVVARAAHIAHRRNVFVLAGLAGEGTFAGEDVAFRRSIGSFRPLAPQEAENIRPNRLGIYQVREGDTWQALAARGGDLVKPTTLAIMNGRAVNEQPRPGERIKIVVSG